MRGGKLISPLGQLRGLVAAGGRQFTMFASSAHTSFKLFTLAIYGLAAKRLCFAVLLAQLFDQRPYCYHQNFKATERFIGFNNYSAIICIYLYMCFLQSVTMHFMSVNGKRCWQSCVRK